MIRINLLPVRQTQKRQTVQLQLLASLGVIIATLIGVIVWSAIVTSDAKKLQQEITQKKNEKRKLDKIIGEVNEFNAKKAELEKKLETIEKLRKGKTGPVRALDDLATEIPNRVWLTEMQEVDSRATIKGIAVDPEDVSAFMKSLEKSKYFQGIQLESSKKKEVTQKGSKTFLYEFKITCQLNYSA